MASNNFGHEIDLGSTPENVRFMLVVEKIRALIGDHVRRSMENQHMHVKASMRVVTTALAFMLGYCERLALVMDFATEVQLKTTREEAMTAGERTANIELENETALQLLTMMKTSERTEA